MNNYVVNDKYLTNKDNLGKYGILAVTPQQVLFWHILRIY